MAVSCTVFDIFIGEKYCDLEISVIRHIDRGKWYLFDSLPMVAY